MWPGTVRARNLERERGRGRGRGRERERDGARKPELEHLRAHGHSGVGARGRAGKFGDAQECVGERGGAWHGGVQSVV